MGAGTDLLREAARARREHARTNAQQRFAPRGGLIAMEPKAFGFFFDIDPPAEEASVREDGIAVIDICGPLEHHASWWCDSYDAIRARFDAALEQKPKGVLLAIDSPGGLVSGCFELARHMRDACAAAAIPLYAYIQGMGASAAYALACAAGDNVGASPTALVGSIGVIDALIDATGWDAQLGIKFTLITSGARKADGNPHQPTSEAAVQASQARVDSLAGIFHAWVNEQRPGLSIEAIEALQANIFVGADARTRGLVDTSTDPSLQIAEPSSTEKSMSTKPASASKAEDTDDEKKDDEAKAEDDAKAARRYLEKRAEEGDEDAKKMLKKMDDDADDEGAKSEGDEDGDHDEDDAKAIAKRALAIVEEDRAQRAKAAVETERAALLASRPDFDASTKTLLASAPIEAVREHVKNAPRRQVSRAASAQPDVRPSALAGGPAPTAEPVDSAELGRQKLIGRLTGASTTKLGAVIERDHDGRVKAVKFGVDVPLAAGEKHPDPLRRPRRVA